MATPWPADPNIEGEGDREYIGPEILRGQFDKPADIFALGLILLEIAGNVVLPDNGISWQRLRSGDMSDVPSLTSVGRTIERDASGEPLHSDSSLDRIYGSGYSTARLASAESLPDAQFEDDKEAQVKLRAFQNGHLPTPPDFMVNKYHSQSLDSIVRWMISPEPGDRPVADEVIATTGCQWAELRRKHGATIYEGNYGPAELPVTAVEIVVKDAEMLDA